MKSTFARDPDVRWADVPASISEVNDALVRLQRLLSDITTQAAINRSRILQVAALAGTEAFLAAETFLDEQGHDLGSSLRQVDELVRWADEAESRSA